MIALRGFGHDNGEVLLVWFDWIQAKVKICEVGGLTYPNPNWILFPIPRATIFPNCNRTSIHSNFGAKQALLVGLT